MRREHFSHTAGPLTAGVGLAHKLFESRSHAPWILFHAFEELVTVVVGFGFLRAGELCIDYAFAQLAKDGVGQRRGDAAGGGDRIDGGGGQELLFIPAKGMLQGDVAYFVTDYAEHFVVAHEVHEPGIHTHGAVGAGECVDVVGLVNLEIQGNAVNRVKAVRNLGEPLDIGIGRRQNGCLGIQLCHGLGYVTLDFFVADRKGGDDLRPTLHETSCIESLGTGHQTEGGQECEE